MKRTASALRGRADFWLNKHFTGKSMDYKQVFGITLPIFVDTSFIVLMAILNTAMISSSGVAAISAVSTVDTLNIFIISVFIAVATGGTVIVAQYKGSGNRDMVCRAAAQAISAVTAFALLISVAVILFHKQTLGLLFGGVDEDVFHKATIFLVGSCISFPFLAVQQAVGGVLRGVGETKASLVISVIMNLAYFLLNFVLIKGFDMGVVGLSISLIAARAIGAAASFVYLLKYNHTLHFTMKRLFKLDVGILKKILFIGLPFAAEQMFFNGGKLLTQTFIVQLGTLALTANAIAGSISMLLQIGGSTLSVAIVTVVGQCIGSRDIEDARKFIKSFLGFSVVLFLLLTGIILPLFPLLMNLYAAPDEIVPSIFHLVLLISIAQPLMWALSFVLPSALRAAGDSKFTSFSSLLTMWLFRIILGYILGITFGMGILGIWIAMVAEWGVRSVIFGLRFKGDKWYKHKLV
ncbi:putative MATE family efflux protein [Cohnella sp. SGD-V74]|uniref:MATE family efflux transporter n=1 Tax=unclassified Cohnella TaxID=2636738 RepID=UPI000D48C978|nr:putative MATE family efflux protein [Cohnella sp. SGD-V74]